jgi:hypothetical protein
MVVYGRTQLAAAQRTGIHRSALQAAEVDHSLLALDGLHGPDDGPRSVRDPLSAQGTGLMP